jgi:uncharacterized protein (UPF0264 family)
MAKLLVSVRSATEAREALAGGAAVIDVKEPARGPLGRAGGEVWGSVASAVAGRAPVSVALGELSEWRGDWADFSGLAFRKLGLAGEGDRPDWPERWAALRDSLGPGPAWVSVVYADWAEARAPGPDVVLDEALRAGCSGLLIDTFAKDRPAPLDDSPVWRSLCRRARSSGLFLALAGRLDVEGMARLACLEPDLFAVRGSACRGGDRLGTIEAGRVARLAEAARAVG